ncbi:MAG: fibronectin type III domain-containing protein [Candidatus Peribacteraceae bacterium]|nr:fibronectin type III domain-containing protein [Candidatus Peribacteraceae bacterium]
MFTQKKHILLRVLTSIVTAFAMLIMAYPATGQTTSPLLTFAPHCILPQRSTCPQYSIQNAQTLQTDALKAGDILDIDIVLKSSNPQEISTVRSWVEYDPATLEARNIELASALPIALPGEQSIDAKTGVIKIGGGTQGKLIENDVAIARITFRVLSSARPTSLRFHNYLADGTGETSVMKVVGTTSTPLLSIAPPSLTIAVAGGMQSSAITQISSSSTSIASSVSGQQSTFGLLQIQNLRVTTKDANLFIGWDGLLSSQLVGYNVYYGNTSGRYMQRRSIQKTSSSLVLRDLEQGKQYFIAVRGFNAANEETAFSQEVGVVVGRAETSTAPLSDTTPIDQPLINGNPIQNNGGTHVTNSGIGTDVALICLVSALIGTAFAWRRHSLASSQL